eukprot:6180649-Amphidinium_carterae.2
MATTYLQTTKLVRYQLQKNPRVWCHLGTESAMFVFVACTRLVACEELYIVATLHISPRAPVDVKAVIRETRQMPPPQQPQHVQVWDNVFQVCRALVRVMIELDDERLDDMRAAPTVQQTDLQPLTLREAA